jgi:hypothetical protein
MKTLMPVIAFLFPLGCGARHAQAEAKRNRITDCRVIRDRTADCPGQHSNKFCELGVQSFG